MAESQSGTVSHVFISHTSQDKVLADALSKAFDDLFGEQGKVRYSTTRRIIHQLNEWNVWTHATAATASIVTGHEDVALQHLHHIHAGPPTVENLRTIEDGLMRLGKNLEKDNATLARWCQALRGS